VDGIEMRRRLVRLQGRHSLNTIVHIDPIGAVILPLVMIFASPTVGRFPVGCRRH
jgi:hypothetical protein